MSASTQQRFARAQIFPLLPAELPANGPGKQTMAAVAQAPAWGQRQLPHTWEARCSAVGPAAHKAEAGGLDGLPVHPFLHQLNWKWQNSYFSQAPDPVWYVPAVPELDSNTQPPIFTLTPITHINTPFQPSESSRWDQSISSKNSLFQNKIAFNYTYETV